MDLPDIEPSPQLAASAARDVMLQRKAALDWAQAPGWAIGYRAHYHHGQGKTLAEWRGPGAGLSAKTAPAPVFFEMQPSERGLTIVFASP